MQNATALLKIQSFIPKWFVFEVPLGTLLDKERTLAH